MTFADDGEAADDEQKKPSTQLGTTGTGLINDQATLDEVQSLLAEGNKIFASNGVQGMVQDLVKAEEARQTAEREREIAQKALQSKAGFQPLLKTGGKKKLSDNAFRALEAGIHVLKDMEREGAPAPPVTPRFYGLSLHQGSELCCSPLSLSIFACSYESSHHRPSTLLK